MALCSLCLLALEHYSSHLAFEGALLLPSHLQLIAGYLSLIPPLLVFYPG